MDNIENFIKKIFEWIKTDYYRMGIFTVIIVFAVFLIAFASHNEGVKFIYGGF